MFRTEYDKILKKIESINCLPRLGGTGKNFYSISFDGYIEYITEDPAHCSSCSSDTYYLSIDYMDLNKPIEFFKDKFELEIKERNDEIQKRGLKEKLDLEEKERNLALKLKEKYNL